MLILTLNLFIHLFNPILALFLFFFLALVTNIAMNSGVQVSVCVLAFHLFHSEVVELLECGSSRFNFLRNCHIFSVTSYYISPGKTKDSDFFLSCQHFPFVLMITILLDVQWYLVVILTCISLMTSSVERLCMFSVFRMFWS